MMRAMISIGRLVAAPQTTLENVKIAMHVISVFRRPKRVVSQPVLGSTMALETR